MVLLGDVIEIESSPEPNPRPATSAAKSRGKRKGRATPPRLGPAASVIELTDSESDVDARVDHSSPVPPSPKPTPNPDLMSNPLKPSDNSHQQTAVLASGSGSGHIECVEEVEAPPVDIGRYPTIPTPDTQLQIPTPPTTPDLGPIPIEEIDPTTTAVAQILEIIPNVEPTHLLELIETHLPTFSVFHEDHDHADGAERKTTVEEQIQRIVGHVLHLLFENPEYLKADLPAGRQGKWKRVDEHDDEDEVEGKGKGKANEYAKKPKIDYASVDRLFTGGPNYSDLALVCPFLRHFPPSNPKSPSITFKSLSRIFPNPTSVANSRSTDLSMRLRISPF